MSTDRGDGVKYLETYFYTAENISRTATKECAIFGSATK
jgi:hypothetical protein